MADMLIVTFEGGGDDDFPFLLEPFIVDFSYLTGGLRLSEES